MYEEDLENEKPKVLNLGDCKTVGPWGCESTAHSFNQPEAALITKGTALGTGNFETALAFNAADVLRELSRTCSLRDEE